MFSSGSVNWRITGAYSTPPRVKRDEKGKVKRKKKKKKERKNSAFVCFARRAIIEIMQDP